MSLAVAFALCFMATFALIWWIERRRAGRVARRLRSQSCPACGVVFGNVEAGDLYRPVLRRRHATKFGQSPRLWALTCPRCGRECWYTFERGVVRLDRIRDKPSDARSRRSARDGS